MCEMLVMREPDLHPALAVNAPVLNAHRIQSGEVVTIQENGHLWGDRDLSHPRWFILKVPEMSVVSAVFLMTPQSGFGDPLSNSLLRVRAHSLDLAGLTERMHELSQAELQSRVYSHPVPSDAHDLMVTS